MRKPWLNFFGSLLILHFGLELVKQKNLILGNLEVKRDFIFVDDLTNIAMQSVIDFLSKDKKNLDFSTHLIFATKNLERAGDHVTNIAETICYLIKGEYLKGSRPKGKQAQE